VGTGGLPDDAELARRATTLKLPQWMAGGNPSEFARQCKWRAEPVNAVAGEWRVRLEERARRRPGQLVLVNRLATAANAEA
jgi:hypothetical protein